MANWVTNVLIVTGDSNQIEELKMFVASKPGSDRRAMQALSFSSVIPMPDNIEDPASWRRQNWGTAKDAWEGGPLISYGDLDQPYSHMYAVLNLLPELKASMEKSPIHWVHIDPAMEDSGLTAQTIGFTTAGSPPTKVIAALSNRYPAMKFDLRSGPRILDSAISASAVQAASLAAVW